MTEPSSPASPALAGRFLTTEPPAKPPKCVYSYFLFFLRSKLRKGKLEIVTEWIDGWMDRWIDSETGR